MTGHQHQSYRTAHDTPTIAVRQCVSPEETRGLTTTGLRENFLIEDLFQPDRVRLTYSHLDRTIVGGVVPLSEAIALLSSKQVGGDTFMERRELGLYNLGGAGSVALDDDTYRLDATDCLYVPMGTHRVEFASDTPSNPARFYLVSAPAHHRHRARKITADDANLHVLGGDDTANRRVLRQYIYPDICASCQLVMGMTVVEAGSVWNTMPCHTHDRRSEVYLYFDMAPETRVFHFMGEPLETRHLIVANEQAVLSPGWSIHSGAGTDRYSFIWSMCGENQDFDDMDMVATEALL